MAISVPALTAVQPARSSASEGPSSPGSSTASTPPA